MTQLTRLSRIKIVTNVRIDSKITRTFKQEPFDKIIQQIFKGINHAFLWSVNKVGEESITIWVFDKSSADISDSRPSEISLPPIVRQPQYPSRKIRPEQPTDQNSPKETEENSSVPEDKENEAEEKDTEEETDQASNKATEEGSAEDKSESSDTESSEDQNKETQ